jgi:hypothetical protein
MSLDRLGTIPKDTNYCYKAFIGENGHSEWLYCPYWTGNTKGSIKRWWGKCTFLNIVDRPKPRDARGLLFVSVKDAACPEYPRSRLTNK